MTLDHSKGQEHLGLFVQIITIYAHDLCLTSLSSAGMQKLLGISSNYAIDHSLTYNAKSSFSLCFIPGTLKFDRPAVYLDNLLIPKVSECKYLCTIICQKNCDLDIKKDR